ncbi:zinc finger CCCH domain-containing protein 35-like [Phragmites australis]|uniref:zinc finger CCCH domain-containing protein 35-like n=1 Tax=Phragmites australis TaxID=29695 RepID=UPI002D7900ED|nr:zinc finger CCCH domain-containing protein 35-like [Phragmites australis]
MMMMGEGAHAPPWQQGPASGGVEGDEGSPYSLLAALRHYLPSNEAAGFEEDDEEAAAVAVDAYACDEFRMYEFKVRRCARGRSHDWTECPFAHPGEKARRRDPRRYHYSGAACPDFRKGGCKRGDSCEFAHGVFECWLHPARYRTQPCKDGTACRRRVCFFAHTPDQLRVLPPQQQSPSPRGASASSPLAESYDGSPLRRQAFESYLTKSMISSSPTSTLVSPPRSPPSESPPMSPDAAGALRRGSWTGVGSPVSDVLASLRQLRLSGSPRSAPSGASFLAGYPSGSYGSTKSNGFYSLPSTPTRPSPVTVTTASGTTIMTVERLNLGLLEEVEPLMERVESGRALREKVFERLSKEATVPNDTAAAATAESTGPATAPDVGWVSDLIN